jgi:hypothetical protein
MKNKLLLAAVALITLITGCSKEGCTDFESEKYDASAKTDNGSCTYEANVVFWHGIKTAEQLQAQNITRLIYYVNNKEVTSSTTFSEREIAPACAEAGAVLFKEAFAGSKRRNYTYSVKDQDQQEIWQGSITVSGNTCYQVALIY